MTGSQFLMPLHKKGSRTTCDNTHGIALLSIPGKVFAKAILNWLKPEQKNSFVKASVVSVEAGTVLTNSSPCEY